jgi:hypothetical protein
MGKSLREMNWKELQVELSRLAHDDYRENQNAHWEFSILNELGDYHKISAPLGGLIGEYQKLHNSFDQFRWQKKAPSKPEIGRFLLSYHGRLISFNSKAIPVLNRLKQQTEKIKNREARTRLKKAISIFETWQPVAMCFSSWKAQTCRGLSAALCFQSAGITQKEGFLTGKAIR